MKRTYAGFDPPDVMCTTAMGNSFGVEICQWTHAEAMKDGRLTDRLNGNVLAAIGPQQIGKWENFSLVVFKAETKAHLRHLRPDEHAVFRKAFFDLIQSHRLPLADPQTPRTATSGRRFEEIQTSEQVS